VRVRRYTMSKHSGRRMRRVCAAEGVAIASTSILNNALPIVPPAPLSSPSFTRLPLSHPSSPLLPFPASPLTPLSPLLSPPLSHISPPPASPSAHPSSAPLSPLLPWVPLSSPPPTPSSPPLFGMKVPTRGSHSFTSQLNLSAFYGIGGACRGGVAHVKGGLGGV